MKKVVIFIILVVVALVAARLSPKAKLTDGIKYSSAVYASNGELLYLTLSEDGIFRLYTPLSNISDSVINATLFYEDRYFYYHFGINPTALLRGFWSTYIKKSRVIGGSTITMQLARVRYDINSSNIGGKLKQMLYAIWLEVCYSKRDILEAYLNHAPYGHNIEGVGAASLIYYHKRAHDLSLVEGFTLSVIPQNPVKRVPTSDSGWSELKKARDPLATAWFSKFPQDKDKFIHFDMPLQIYKISNLPYHTPHFVNYVLKEQNSEYFTTINLDKQNILNSVIRNFITKYNHFGVKNAAALLVNTDTMNIEAYVGSADFYDNNIQGQVDGTRAMRSPGSMFKPFIYALAIDKGLIHSHTLLKDAPKRYGLYSPENSDKNFMGPLFAIDALNSSRNIPAVQLLIDVGIDKFINILKKAGVKNLKDAAYYGGALALGGFESSMQDAAVFYSALNNEGRIYKLNTLLNDNKTYIGDIFTPEAAFITRNMLRQNPPPHTGGFFYKFPFPVAWKTGTSYIYRDAWAGTVFSNYVLVVWVGNFDGTGNPFFTGSATAAPLAFDIITHLRQYIDYGNSKDIPEGYNLKYVNVCSVNGELPTDFCPSVIPTLFIPGVSPIKKSDIFQQLPIDKKSGLRACYHDSTKTELKVFELWPADILELYEKAGILKEIPPPYMPECTIEDKVYKGLPPVITYPLSGVIYDMANSPAGNNEIPFTASSSADASIIYWFVDGAFSGESENGKSFFWKAEPGKHLLEAVDNLGRSTSINFESM